MSFLTTIIPDLPMSPVFCKTINTWDLTDTCVLGFWSAVVPVALVLLFLVYSASHRCSTTIIDDIQRPQPGPIALADDDTPHIPLHRSSFIGRPALLAAISFIEFASWLTLGTYKVVTHEGHLGTALTAVLISLTWLYGSAKPAFCPKATAYVDLFILYLSHLWGGVLFLGPWIYFYPTTPVPVFNFIGVILNLVAIVSCLALVSTMPQRLPSQEPNCSPEDSASMYDRGTFGWVDHLIKLGDDHLTNDDIWDLTPDMRSKYVSQAFDTIRYAWLF